MVVLQPVQRQQQQQQQHQQQQHQQQQHQQQQRRQRSSDGGEKGSQHDVGKALILVLGTLIILPGSFSYYILMNALREQNVCHIGPIAALQPHPTLDHAPKFYEKRASLRNLYGTYTTFDDASYYFVKTPYEIAPQVLPDYGYWSLTTLALTLLSPKLRQSRQDNWKLRDEENTFFNMETAPAIQWDQSHQINFQLAQQQNYDNNGDNGNNRHGKQKNAHSSQSNRWCLVNHQDPNMYRDRKKDDTEEKKKFEKMEENDMNLLKYKRAIFGTTNNQKATVVNVEATESKHAPDKSNQVFRICAPPQTSILSSGDQAPYFVELPLQPPHAGTWRKFETDNLLTQTDDDDGDVGGGSGSGRADYARFRRNRKPTNPYQVKVQCHVRDLELSHLAHGSLQPDAQPHLGWEHAARIPIPVLNVFYVPGTLAVLVGLLLIQLRKRPFRLSRSGRPLSASAVSSSLSARRQQQQQQQQHYESPEELANNGGDDDDEWNLVRAVQQIWQHDSWYQWAMTSIWVYLLGTCLEPLVGTMPYLGITLAFLQLVATVVVSSSSDRSSTTNTFLWICFGQSILLAQLEPSLTIGPVEISSISLGDSSNALQINVVNVLVGLAPILQSPSILFPWRSVAACIVVGWSLAKPLMMELLGAPQWTIPTLLLAHLWWKLTKLPDEEAAAITEWKKTDEEMTPFCDADHLSTINSDDGKSSVEGLSMVGPSTDDASANSYTSTDAVVSTTKEQVLKIIKLVGVYIIFASWILLTIGCIFTMDWTLVVGNMMTLWLCIGCNQFPHHPLWALYHMVASSVIIILNTMTVMGWYLCHVAIATRALHALSPTHVYGSMALQTIAHFVALLHTVRTKGWETATSSSQQEQVPGHYFWRNVRVVGEEIRLWYHVFF